VRIKVYVEGGGNRNLDRECRKAFAALFERADLTSRKPAVIPCGGRRSTYDDFCTALRKAISGELPVLLVDSEGPVTAPAWQHVRNRPGDGWERPDGATDDHLHLMVQVMETWFLADRENLVKYYGSDFHENRLPNTVNLEDCPKQTVFDSLESASRDTSKGRYNKGSHSFRILGELSPTTIEGALPHAKQFFDFLRRESG